MKSLLLVCILFLSGCSLGKEQESLQDKKYAEYLRIQKYNVDMCMKSSGTVVISNWDWSFSECKGAK